MCNSRILRTFLKILGSQIHVQDGILDLYHCQMMSLIYFLPTRMHLEHYKLCNRDFPARRPAWCHVKRRLHKPLVSRARVAQPDIARNVFGFDLQCYIHAIRCYHAMFCGKRGGRQRQVHDDFQIGVGDISGTLSSHQRQSRCSPYVIESIHGAKHSPTGRRGASDCPSAQMQTSDFQVVSGHFGLEFESLMMYHGMKSNNGPSQWCPKKILGVLRFIVVTPEHV